MYSPKMLDERPWLIDGAGLGRGGDRYVVRQVTIERSKWALPYESRRGWTLVAKYRDYCVVRGFTSIRVDDDLPF
jgi:hypothetical protein